MRDALERDRLIDRLWVAVPESAGARADRRVGARGSRWTATSRCSRVGRRVATCSPRTAPAHRRLLRAVRPRLRDRADSSDERRVTLRVRPGWSKRRSSRCCRPMRHEGAFTAPARPVAGNDTRTQATSVQDEILDAARRIGRQTLALALRQNRRMSWLGLTLVRDRDWAMQPVGADLYGGTIGIALFLAYFDHVAAHHESSSNRARRRRPGRTPNLGDARFARVRAARFHRASLGAFGTLGGAIYAFAHLGALWQDHRVARSGRPRHVRADAHCRSRPTISTSSAVRLDSSWQPPRSSTCVRGGCTRAALQARSRHAGRAQRAVGCRTVVDDRAAGDAARSPACRTARQEWRSPSRRLGSCSATARWWTPRIDALRYERSTFDAEHLQLARLSNSGRSQRVAERADPHVGLVPRRARHRPRAARALGGVGDAAVNDDLAVALESDRAPRFRKQRLAVPRRSRESRAAHPVARARSSRRVGGHSDRSESTRLVGRLRARRLAVWHSRRRRDTRPDDRVSPASDTAFLRLATPQRVPSLLSLEGPRVAVSRGATDDSRRGVVRAGPRERLAKVVLAPIASLGITTRAGRSPAPRRRLRALVPRDGARRARRARCGR